MLQERKPRFCGIFATFFQSETQVLMTVSDLLGFFSRNYFLEGGFTFQWGGIWFSFDWSLNFKRRGAHWGHWLWWEGRFLKNITGWSVQFPAHYRKSWYTCTTSFKMINIDIMECFVVIECIYNVDACKSTVLLCYIASKFFGQQWVFEKVEKAIQMIWKQIIIVKNNLL